MKKYAAILLAVMMLLSAAACGKEKPEAPTVPASPAPVASGSDTVSSSQVSGSDETSRVDLGTIGEDNTYWIAQGDNWLYLKEEEMISELDFAPGEKYVTDLILWTDGTARFRNLHHSAFVDGTEDKKLTWEMKGDKVYVYNRDAGEPSLTGEVKDGKIIFQHRGSLGDEIIMRQAVMPTDPGLLYTPIELLGTWTAVSSMVDGYESNLLTEGHYMSLAFEQYWADFTPFLQVSYEENLTWLGEGVDGMYDASITLCDTPLYEGCGNDRWSVKLNFPKGEYNDEYYVTLVGKDTLLLQHFFDFDGALGVSYTTFERSLPRGFCYYMPENDLMYTKWEIVGYIDENGARVDKKPETYKDMTVIFFGGDLCDVSWSDKKIGNIFAGGSFHLGRNGSLMIFCDDSDLYELLERPVLFAGGQHQVYWPAEGQHDNEMYLRFGNDRLIFACTGIIEEGAAGDGAGENNDDESYIPMLEGNAFAAPGNALAVMYGEDFLDMHAEPSIPIVDLAPEGEGCYLLISSVSDNSRFWFTDENGETLWVNGLLTGESVIFYVRLDAGWQFWMDLDLGETYYYDLTSSAIDLTDWTYITY